MLALVYSTVMDAETRQTGLTATHTKILQGSKLTASEIGPTSRSAIPSAICCFVSDFGRSMTKPC